MLHDSVKCLEKAIEIKPNDVESLDVLLSHYTKLKDEEKVQETWKKILVHSWDYGNHCALLGEKVLSSGNAREAFLVFLKGLKAKPDYDFLKEMMELCLNQFGQSLKKFDEVIDSFNGNYKEAANFYRKMAKENPALAFAGDS